MLSLMLQKSRVLQTRGINAVVVHRKPVTTKEVLYYRLSGRVDTSPVVMQRWDYVSSITI